MTPKHDSPQPKNEQLRARVPPTHEVKAFDAQLAAHHYLGAGRPVGHYLRQVIELDGRPAALLVWGPSCYSLKDRDRWIAWSAPQRVERLKLIVQNRRFLLLNAKGQSPNLASQAMGAALRARPEQWREHFGYRPLLAESFTDPESHAGTSYKASNWEPVGMSQGFSRPGGLPFGSAAPQATADTVSPGGLAPCPRSSRQEHAVPHRTRAEPHRHGALGRAAGYFRDRPFRHHLDAPSAPPVDPAAQERHACLLQSPWL